MELQRLEARIKEFKAKLDAEVELEAPDPRKVEYYNDLLVHLQGLETRLRAVQGDSGNVVPIVSIHRG